MMTLGQDDAPSYWLSVITPNVFPSLASLPAKAEVVIVGGGLMGISIAYWLARCGVDVLLTESRWLSWGATGRNAGLMLAGASPLEDAGLVQRVLAEEGIEADYAETGHLALASSEEIWSKIRSEASARRNSPRPLYALERAACEDLLKMRIAGHFLGGRWFQQGAMVHSTRFVYGLALAAMRYGALVTTQTRVLNVEPRRDDWLGVSTTRGDVRARYVVYACNVWASELLPGLSKVITPVRGQVLATEPLPSLFEMGMAVDWGTVYWRQTADGRIILGGNPEPNSGPERECRELVNERIQKSLELFLPQSFPGFPDFKVSQRWAGIMDCSKDQKPIIGPLPGGINQWVVVGFNGHGMPLGLGVGKAVAESLDNGLVLETLTPFSPARFAELLPADS